MGLYEGSHCRSIHCRPEIRTEGIILSKHSVNLNAGHLNCYTIAINKKWFQPRHWQSIKNSWWGWKKKLNLSQSPKWNAPATFDQSILTTWFFTASLQIRWWAWDGRDKELRVLFNLIIWFGSRRRLALAGRAGGGDMVGWEKKKPSTHTHNHGTHKRWPPPIWS